IFDLSGDAHAEPAHVEAFNGTDSGLFGADPFPETFHTFADASDGAEPGDDNASPIHAVTVFCCASTYAFIQRKVLLATLPIKKSPMIGFMIGARAGMRKLSSCKISTRTPSGVSANVQTTCIPFVKALR